MENEVKEPALKYNYTSAEEYLKMERSSPEKHELHQGNIVAMSGASRKHNQIFTNLIVGIGSFLKDKSCNIYGNDFRVKIPSEDTFTYPDILIVCEEEKLTDDKFDTLTNPSVLIEILSPSTEKYDKGNKFFFYKQIPSLREYLMISSTEIYIQAARKNADDSWKFELLTDLQGTLNINTIQYNILLKDIYHNVQF